MNSDLLRQFKFQIQNAITETHRKMAQIREELLEAAEARPKRILDEPDQVKEEIDLNTQIEIHRRYLNMSRHLTAALERIRRGTYGLCVNCEEDIERRRLDVLPTALLCFRCQSLEEKESSQYSHNTRQSYCPNSETESV